MWKIDKGAYLMGNNDEYDNRTIRWLEKCESGKFFDIEIPKPYLLRPANSNIGHRFVHRVMMVTVGGTIAAEYSKGELSAEKGADGKSMMDRLLSEVPEEYEIWCTDVAKKDSSAITSLELDSILAVVKRDYDEFHDFLVIHGTDSIEETPIYIAHSLQNADTTVLFTGAQYSMDAPASDGPNNILCSLKLFTALNGRKFVGVVANSIGVAAGQSCKIDDFGTIFLGPVASRKYISLDR